MAGYLGSQVAASKKYQFSSSNRQSIQLGSPLKNSSLATRAFSYSTKVKSIYFIGLKLNEVYI